MFLHGIPKIGIKATCVNLYNTIIDYIQNWLQSFSLFTFRNLFFFRNKGVSVRMSFPPSVHPSVSSLVSSLVRPSITFGSILLARVMPCTVNCTLYLSRVLTPCICNQSRLRSTQSFFCCDRGSLTIRYCMKIIETLASYINYTAYSRLQLKIQPNPSQIKKKIET